MRNPPKLFQWLPGAALSPRGFSLLEVLVALVLVSVVLIGVHRLYSQSIPMNRVTRFDTVAPLLAQLKLADLAQADPDDLRDGEGDFGDDFPGYTWRLAIEASESEALGTPAKDLKRIELHVALDGGGVFDLRTYRYYGSDVDIATP